MSASAATSQTSVSGLVGVSANSSFVLGCSALFHSARSVCDTKVVWMPNLPNSPCSSLIVEPNTERETHDVVARLQQAHHQQHDRGHARRRRDAGLGAFERGQPALHHHDRRIGEAAVDEGLLLVGETARGGGRVRVHEGAGQIERLGVLAPGRRRQALAHRERVQPRVLGQTDAGNAAREAAALRVVRHHWSPPLCSARRLRAGRSSSSGCDLRWACIVAKSSALTSPVMYWPSKHEASKPFNPGRN